MYDYRSKWALDACQGFQNSDKEYTKTCKRHYKELWKRGIGVDIVNPMSDLSGYKLVIMPMLYSMSEAAIANIEKYVASGGTAVATYITGYANETDLCYLGGFPGSSLKAVFGLVNNEIDTLYKGESNLVRMGEKEYSAVDYCELVTPTTADVLAEYASDFYIGKPVLLKNKYKNGKAYYIACRDTGELLNDVYEKIIGDVGLRSYTLPDGVSLHTREDSEYTYYFIENYLDIAQTVTLEGEFTDAISNAAAGGAIDIAGYGVRVLKEKK